MNGVSIYNGITNIPSDMIDEAERYAGAGRKQHAGWRALIAVAACLLVFVIAAAPVLAAGINAFCDRLYVFFPAVAQTLRPVSGTCVSQGVEMKVEEVGMEDDRIHVTVSMRGTEDAKLRGLTDLNDSYSICDPYDSGGSCSFLYFDSRTDTAYWLVTLFNDGQQLRPGDKLTFGVRQLLYGGEETEKELEMIDLSDVPQIKDYYPSPYYASGSGYDPARDHLIAEDLMPQIPLCKGVALTGYGEVDGVLHVQILYSEVFDTANHGEVYLKGKNSGNVIRASRADFFKDRDRSNGSDRYTEYFFRYVDRDALPNFEVWGWFVSRGAEEHIDGNWHVTVKIPR